MCNLYTERLSPAEIAAHFGVSNPMAANVGGEVYPGATGLVVRDHEGTRVMETMTWGFPLKLKTMAPSAKPKPVNNVADLAKPMWKGIASKPQWRCLIPLTAFAEAEGPKGAKTRTWFAIKNQSIFAWAGFWRFDTQYDWGAVYSGLMTECNEAIRPVHDRMPVLLHSDEYEQWLHGTYEDVLGFQARCFPDDLIEMTRTDEYWDKRKGSVSAPATLI